MSRTSTGIAPGGAALPGRQGRFEVSPALRARRIDELEVDDVTALVAALTDAGYKRETISKSRDALAMVLDHHQVEPNVVRDKRVKLPKERKPHVPPPLAEHVERVAETRGSRFAHGGPGAPPSQTEGRCRGPRSCDRARCWGSGLA